MEVIVDGRKRDIEFSGDISALIAKLGFMREEVVVKVNCRLAPDTRVLSDKDSVEVIKVVFGG